MSSQETGLSSLTRRVASSACTGPSSTSPEPDSLAMARLQTQGYLECCRWTTRYVTWPAVQSGPTGPDRGGAGSQVNTPLPSYSAPPLTPPLSPSLPPSLLLFPGEKATTKLGGGPSYQAPQEREAAKRVQRKRKRIPVFDESTELSDATIRANLADDSDLLRSPPRVSQAGTVSAPVLQSTCAVMEKVRQPLLPILRFAEVPNSSEKGSSQKAVFHADL